MTEPTASPTPRQRIPAEVWVLVAASFVIALGYGVVAPALPAFARTFDVSITAASAVVSVFAIMRLAFAPATGPLVRRLGERSVYMAGLLIVAASTLAVAFAQTYWQLLLFRGLGGVGSVMFTVSAMGLMIRIAPAEIRGRVAGVYSSSFVVGSICGPLLGGALVGFGLRVPFVVYAVALVVATAVVWLALRNSRLAQPAAEDSGPGTTVRAALRDSAYRAALFTAVTFGWVYSMRVSLLPLFFADVLGQPAAIAGYALAAYALGDVLAMFPAGRASDRFGRRPFIVTGMLVIAVGTAALGCTDSVVVAFAVTVLAGFGTGLVAPTIQASLADVLHGKARGGSALSSYQMAQDAGTISGPLLAGVIAQYFGYTWAFVVTAILCVLAAVAWLLARETRVVVTA
ncbi:Major facilitator superfamily MFS_1 OS=Tsukamurella paurometabola (strain ATCC 8368 / DSM /CCUG 35730 / CIP 100753 / JCM 10117 / KCTC 9821 / NBRC 16120/ NCIMB 702349 / NCTC 13040) OX=521096 GN=Tpau_3242 PE=3 SV=1 [Tsukamurella paurometabola]|uniref:Major facilitator superfamily MFS_1 n=1 Tax=Tsukamurella paurometabola (strain ATCC 8368 / DSM 20162 / CCUG 35730 / CIP 100753 / JCM 10117 / KCTC 9821 / NBRC 16120 / NCIMB 702349 / NCTC 13040) TaxID=521096 RepID=D5UVP5_TSUPD|nr:MFS transporter [Tsukamurella paurometabola]ADG79827.1 major facilitator superfamily MFS_1 [Tsukamurella paurometabola DSM 20162]SUP37353.1 Metal-tetracycline/H(+) antiporter [Tsukamurella paurometabola]